MGGVVGVVLLFFVWEEARDKVGAVNFLKFVDNVASFFGFVPEKEETLVLFFFGGVGCEDRFQGVGVKARGEDFCGDRHRGGGKVLNLLEFEVEVVGFGG